MIVLKLGGSLFRHGPDILKCVERTGMDVLVVPGGGEFADLVRKVDVEYSLSDDASHWMAVLAMDQYAYYLSDMTGIPLTSDFSDREGIRIALPYEMLRKKDDLPHSWDVTSDTIAAWIAHMTGSLLIKATDVDGIIKDGTLIERIDAPALAGSGESCIDAALPHYLMKYGMNALVVNGLYGSRIEDAVLGKKTVGTLILGK